ncbi:MAG: UDP-N-acetylmuramoyl-tripeptide--D-alanyl-D-alanine ligase [Clostridiales bacterium]|nr:UDP-N-acetylmuramoyl-tripeptide--D-alanyl-D-alanine ligase [Clostridiales bacterium]
MFPFTIAQLAHITGGTFVGDPALLSASPRAVTIDTRLLQPDDLYVAIRGLFHDGHAFAEEAMRCGARCCLTDCAVPSPHILVADTVAALHEIALAYRRLFDIAVIGVTGSVGKTTVKEMLCAVLSQRYVTHKSKGNLNNQTGVPQTLLGITPEHQVAVVEMGTNHFGEIAELARITEPTLCVLTNIGESHIEFFGTRAGIFREKTAMLAHMRPGGMTVVNGDDDLLATLHGAVTYGLSLSNAVYADDLVSHGLDGTSFTAHYFGHTLCARVPMPGKHMVTTALCAVAVGHQLGLSAEEMACGIESFVPPAGRMHIQNTGHFVLINDAYNASPTSMRASINVLCAEHGRKVLIFGDMLELGESGPAYHEEVGQYALAHGVDLLLCVGPLAKAATDDSRAFWFATQEELIAALPALLNDGDTILVKGSYGMQLHRTAQAISEM